MDRSFATLIPGTKEGTCLKNIIAMVKPSQKAIDGAADTLNTTAIGAAFVLQFFLMAGLVWYIVRGASKEKDSMRQDARDKTTQVNEILASKDETLATTNKDWADKFEKLNEDMQEVALGAVKVGTIVTERLKTMISLQKDTLELMRREGNGGSTTSPDG